MRYMNRGKYVTDSKESTTKIIESSYFFGIILILLFFMIIPVKSSDNNDKSEKAKYEENVSIAVKSLKKVYEPNEPVPVIIAIANHSSEPIYLFENEEDFLKKI